MEYPSLAPRGNTGGFFYSVLSKVRHGFLGFFIKFVGTPHWHLEYLFWVAVNIKTYRKLDCGYETVLYAERQGARQLGVVGVWWGLKYSYFAL